MKDHLKKYYPERFEDNDAGSWLRKFTSLLDGKEKWRRTKCEMAVELIYERSNELKLLAGAMRKYGCNFKLSRHVSCELCGDCQGGFDPDTKQIIVCFNGSLERNKVMSNIMHEMIHMFDYCRAEFDFNNLEHIACSEIRAANLTFCSPGDRLKFGGPLFNNFKGSHRQCVEDVAFHSVKAYSPETEDSKIRSIIDKVFPTCYNDLEPFGRRPHGRSDILKQSYRERYYYGYT